MVKRLIWIGACALTGLLVAFAGMSSASTGQNNNNNAGGGANSNANRGRHRGNSNANGGDMSANSNANSTANANSGLASSDQKFVNEAAIGGMAEVEMGRLGVERGTSDDVKTFAQRLIDDHTKANAELTQIAGTKGVMLPTGLDAKHQAVIDKLRSLSGDAFDREFAKVGVKDHQEDIKDFQKESASGKDADIKGFATRTLPVLQDHLRMAQDAAARLKGAKAGGNANMSGHTNANSGGMNSNMGGNMNSNMNMNSNGNSNRRKSRNSNSNAGGNSNNSNNGNRR